MYAIHESLKKKPKCRVELHIHLDGAVRHETIWELLRKKNLTLPGNGSLNDLKKSLMIAEPKNLLHFLKPFETFMPSLIDDLDAIERIAYEFVEDQARESVLYCEARFCPQFFLSEQSDPGKVKNGDAAAAGVTEENGNFEVTSNDTINTSSLTIDCVVDACLRGLQRGEENFGTKVRLILFCIMGKMDWSLENLRLCEKYRDKGIVGIDIAGYKPYDQDIEDAEEAKIFQQASVKGIHITVHAGEVGGALEVQKALRVLNAERIGHGYHVLEDEEIYKKCLEDRIHFEMCPHSSYLTGSIKTLNLESKRHPILRLSEDGASFSISSDNPTVTNTRIGDEYQLLQKWGFTEAQFTKANFEAAKRCFLPHKEKEQLLNKLRDAYGIPSSHIPDPKVICSVLPKTQQNSTPPSPTTEKSPKQATTTMGIQKLDFKIASWKDRAY